MVVDVRAAADVECIVVVVVDGAVLVVEYVVVVVGCVEVLGDGVDVELLWL